ncbi:MAG: helix-hairpin-helix domain-containing protein [bacterium]|nr:MAG: helix-hairpin-helix domain-containing protein [bacterium]
MAYGDPWRSEHARRALILLVVLTLAGQIHSWHGRPVIPQRADAGTGTPWPPPVSERIVDRTELPTGRLDVYPSGTTIGEAVLSLSLPADPAGSATVLPRAGVLTMGPGGWTVRPMSQVERYVWGIPMDLNSVGVEDLVRIPGIGKVLAEYIYGFISQVVWVSSVSRLDAVPGIGPAKLRTLSKYLEVQ